MSEEKSGTEKDNYKAPVGKLTDFHFNAVDFQASADWIVLRQPNKQNKPTAEMFHVYYRQLQSHTRPVTFVFNGGPGASSAYLHMGALGPKRVAFGHDGSLLAPPARLVGNQESWLEFSDLVFVDPVGTGFSRDVSKEAKGDDKKPEDSESKEFYQVEKDLQSLGDFIVQFLSKHRLWSRPIFIAGESYGGFRVAKLARKLQETHGVGLSGAILISPALEFTLLEGSDYDTLNWTDAFPSLALAAAHHGRSQLFSKDTSIEEVRKQSEVFACEELSLLLLQGEMMAPARRHEICEKMSQILGLPAEVVAKSGGRLPISSFSRLLLRDEGKVLGLYDSTATCLDPFPDRDTFQGADPTLFAIEPAFTGAINIQLREELGLECERDYKLLSLDVNSAWKCDIRQHDLQTQIGATDDLRYGMALNPHMQVFLCHGLYDLVTPYFSSHRILNCMKLHPSQMRNFQTRYYVGGHMFYTWENSRRQFRDDIRAFYHKALSQGPKDL